MDAAQIATLKVKSRSIFVFLFIYFLFRFSFSIWCSHVSLSIFDGDRVFNSRFSGMLRLHCIWWPALARLLAFGADAAASNVSNYKCITCIRSRHFYPFHFITIMLVLSPNVVSIFSASAHLARTKRHHHFTEAYGRRNVCWYRVFLLMIGCREKFEKKNKRKRNLGRIASQHQRHLNAPCDATKIITATNIIIANRFPSHHIRTWVPDQIYELCCFRTRAHLIFFIVIFVFVS